MSRTVDPENMSKFDRQYLQDRNIDPDEYAQKFVLDEDDVVVPRLEDDEESDEESGDEDVPYSQWQLKELKRELKSRNLSYAGKDPAVLITRLEEDDAEKAEDSDTPGEGDDDEGSDDEDA